MVGFRSHGVSNASVNADVRRSRACLGAGRGAHCLRTYLSARPRAAPGSAKSTASCRTRLRRCCRAARPLLVSRYFSECSAASRLIAEQTAGYWTAYSRMQFTKARSIAYGLSLSGEKCSNVDSNLWQLRSEKAELLERVFRRTTLTNSETLNGGCRLGDPKQARATVAYTSPSGRRSIRRNVLAALRGEFSAQYRIAERDLCDGSCQTRFAS